MEAQDQTKPYFIESDQYKPGNVDPVNRNAPNDIVGIEEKLWEHVHQHAKQNDPVSVYWEIDKFCKSHWMMNLGPEKGLIVKDRFQEIQPKTILELGTYCGYSSVYFSALTSPQTKIYTLQINENTMKVAHKIFQWAGVLDRVIQLKGNIQHNIEKIKSVGHFDVIFLDHWKTAYLADFKFLQSNGVIQKGTVIIADNVICPGVPDYIEYVKNSNRYQSVLYHSQLQYQPSIPDAVLVSKAL